MPVTRTFALSFLAALAVSTTAQAEILWRGDFETGDLSQWDTLNPVTGNRMNINVGGAQVFAGEYAAEIVIHPDDLWSNGHNRVELHYDAQRTGEGQTTFFSWYFMLPENVQVHEDIAYWESDVSYQQTMALYADPAAGGMELSFRTNRPSSMRHWTGPISAGTWHQVAMEILWSTDASVGKVSLWLDNALVVDNVSAQTKADANPVFIQMGFHRDQTQTPVETIYIDEAVEGTTREDILPPPGSGGGSGGMAGGGGTPPGSGGAIAGSGGAGTGGSAAGSGGTTSGGGSSSGGASTGGATSGGATSGGAPSGGSSGTGGSSPAADDDGCGCRVAGQRGSPALLAGLAALGLALFRRRRA